MADEVLQARLAAWAPGAPAFDSGWLQLYRRNVRPLANGAVLVDPH